MQSFVRVLIAAAVGSAFLCACSTTSTAPVEDRGDGQAASAGQGPTASQAATTRQLTYTVKKGDNLYRIAKNHDVPLKSLMTENNISDPSKLAIGRVLTIPGRSVRGAAPTEATTKSSGIVETVTVIDRPAATPAPAPAPEPEEEEVEKPVAAPVVTPVKTTTTTTSSSSDVETVPGTSETLAWPVKGSVASAFTVQTRGIDIQAKRGTDVGAAANGEVLLTSSSFRGYGNLIIVRHGDGTFVTTYGQLATIDVKKGDRVTVGQKIGTVGGFSASKPVLHFEVRISGQPVDPAKYLP